MTQEEVYSLALNYANDIAGQYDIDDPETMARMLTGIAYVESKYDETAKNKSSSALGLMQMVAKTQKEVETKRAKVDIQPHDALLDPDYAMMLAAHELGYQWKRIKKDRTWQKAVHGYNQGSWPGTHKYDGQLYAQKVMKVSGDDDLFAEMDFGADRREFY